MTRRILLVEDTEDNREIVRDLMDSVGYEAHVAASCSIERRPHTAVSSPPAAPPLRRWPSRADKSGQHTMQDCSGRRSRPTPGSPQAGARTKRRRATGRATNAGGTTASKEQFRQATGPPPHQ